ncbi:EboA domain-containing protein [Telmatospirillum siberiense]|uniref:DUF2336 domain-containing protein n=1 Tax=Telmatospirillum siberiense TaxID=382514 RepID=A0A2N3PZS5_9PROT|nr:EboA domain-containing protein [Telmatospirillum siberiense]PKU25903.1 hypothetical protein CWS72_04965 [Telmatospirillum siberiense]
MSSSPFQILATEAPALARRLAEISVGDGPALSRTFGAIGRWGEHGTPASVPADLTPDGRMTIGDLLRAALLERAVPGLGNQAPAALRRLTQTGDTAERVIVLRMLHRLPEPDRFLDIALEACRSSVLPVFAAIACGNPYPARFFPAAAFNQLIAKLLLSDLPLTAVIGLSSRRTADLLRIAEAYASERRAAGRPLHPDFPLLSNTQQEIRP